MGFDEFRWDLLHIDKYMIRHCKYSGLKTADKIKN